MSLPDRTHQLDLVCFWLAGHYIFPDVGAQVVDLLRAGHADGDFADISTDQEFGIAMTETMQSVNGDRHLRLLYSIDAIPAPDEDVAEVDLRRCPGGSPLMVAHFCSYLFEDPTHLNDIYDRPTDQTRQFWTAPSVPGEKFGGTKPVYVLTSSSTFSGAEELSYDLQSRGRATVVGERTKGGAHPGRRYRIGPHLELAVPQGRAINPVTGTNWEGTGVQPDIDVSAENAFDTAYRLALTHVISLGCVGVRRAIAHEAEAAMAGLHATS